MRKLQQGDFVRLNNDEIPRHIELLQANGYNIWEGQWNMNRISDDIIIFEDGTFNSDNSATLTEVDTELSKHDWVCAVIGLEEGDTLDDSIDRKTQLAGDLIKLGVNCCDLGKEILFKHLESYPLVFFKGQLHGTFEESVVKPISYSEWCKKLGVEPIYEYKGSYPKDEEIHDIKRIVRDLILHLESKSNSNIITLPDGTTVDLSKPIECPDNSANWVELLPSDETSKIHFVGFTQQGQCVFDLSQNFPSIFIAKQIRNTPETEFKEGDLAWHFTADGYWTVVKIVQSEKDDYPTFKHDGVYCFDPKLKPYFNPDGTPNFPPFND